MHHDHNLGRSHCFDEDCLNLDYHGTSSLSFSFSLSLSLSLSIYIYIYIGASTYVSTLEYRSNKVLGAQVQANGKVQRNKGFVIQERKADTYFKLRLRYKGVFR